MADTDDDSNEAADTKTKRKSRRSTIFHRKSSLFNSENRQSFESDENCKSGNLSDSVVDTQEEKRKLLEYLHDLEKENKDWKALFRSYKSRYHALKDKKNHSMQLTLVERISKLRGMFRKQNKKTQMLDVSSCSKFLTDEDRQFLSGRPDCIAIGRKLDEAIDSIKMCMKIHNELMTVTCSTVRKAKQEMDTIKHIMMDKAHENEEIHGMFDGNQSVESFLSSYSDSGC